MIREYLNSCETTAEKWLGLLGLLAAGMMIPFLLWLMLYV